MSKFKRALRVAVALPLLVTLVGVALVGGSQTVYADGNGSPSECLDTNPDVIGSVSGTDDLVVKDVGSGKVVDGVCIKSGNYMFNGATHSGVLGNGEYSGDYQFPNVFPSFDDCYEVSGVGTQEVTVKRNQGTPSCKGISHIDVVTKDAPRQDDKKKFAWLKIEKDWVEASDPDNLFDENDVTTEFEVKSYKWSQGQWQLSYTTTVSEDQWFLVKKFRYVVVTEKVDGFNDQQCEYTPDDLDTWVSWKKWNKHTVTNTVDCEPGGRGGQPVVPADDEPAEEKKEKEEQVDAPVVAAVDAGAGPAVGSAVLGLLTSITAVAGVATRKLSAVLES
jgi:hypothetical protein